MKKTRRVFCRFWLMLDNSLKYEHDSFFSHFWKALKFEKKFWASKRRTSFELIPSVGFWKKKLILNRICFNKNLKSFRQLSAMKKRIHDRKNFCVLKASDLIGKSRFWCQSFDIQQLSKFYCGEKFFST